MYSRDFSDKAPGGLPPHYGGTAFGRGRQKEPCPKEERCPSEQEREGISDAPHRHEDEPCDDRGSHGKPPPPKTDCTSPKGSLLSRLLPFGNDSSDLLLLGLAILLLSDGCEDELLPLILLFLLIIN